MKTHVPFTGMVRALALFTVLMPAATVLLAQETRSLHDAVRNVSREIERESEQTLRERLRPASVRRDPSALLAMATLERLSFHTQDAERAYRALIIDASPTVRAHASFGLASLFAQSARFADAVPWFDSASKHFTALGDSVGRSETHLGQAQALLRTRGVSASGATLARARAEAPRSDDVLRAQIACATLALRVRAAEHVRAREFQDARVRAHQVSARAESVCRLAEVELAEGRGEQALALALLDTMARMQRNARLLDRLSATLQWQGWLLLSSGHYVHARVALEEAVTLGDAAGTLGSAGWANLDLAELAQRVGSWSDAGKYAERAERALALAGDRVGYTTARELAGHAALASGDLERASRTFTSVQRETFAVYPRNAVDAFLARSDIARRANDSVHARILLDSAERLTRSHDLPGLNNDLAYRRAMMDIGAGRLADARRLLTTMLDGQRGLSPLLRYQLLARLAEVDARDERLPSAQALLERAFHELDLWRASLMDRGFRLAASQARSFDWDTDLGIATTIGAIAMHGSGEVALRLADSRRARVLLDEAMRRNLLVDTSARGPKLADRMSVDLSRRLHLSDGTAVIAYTTGDGGEPTTILVIVGGRTTAIVTTSGDSIADLARRFVAFLDAGHLARPAARRLASVLIDPVLPLLSPTVKRLVIVPDGSIHRVPFAALLLHGDSLLAQRFEVTTAPSVGIALNGLPRASGSLLASGNPPRDGVLAFGAPVSAAIANAASENAWPPLPGARDEMRGVARLVLGTEVIEGQRATLAALRNASSRAGPVLHLATHARAMENSLMSGAMLLASDGDRPVEATTPEIAAMTLPFDLVVLSACESASGSLLSGEGLQGLANAFLEAGARAVLATRWRLGDRDGRAFLETFYRALIDGHDAVGALGTARRQAIAKRVSPAIWANFELIGDPTVAPHLTANRPWMRGAMLLAALLVLCVGLYGARLAVSRNTL